MKKTIVSGFIITLFIISLFFIRDSNSFNQSAIDYGSSRGKLLITNAHEPVIDIVQYNASSSSIFLLIGFLTHFETFLINKDTMTINFLSTQSFGLNSNSFLWSVKKDGSNNFIAALSNGTVFSFSFNFKLNWSQKFSSQSISDLNVLQNGVFVAISDSGNIYWFYSQNGTIIKTFNVPSTYFTISTSFENYFLTGNDNGTIFLFDFTQSIFNETIGAQDNQVIALALNQNYFIGYCYNSSLEAYNISTGTKLSNKIITDIDFNALFLFNSTIYYSTTDGILHKFDLNQTQSSSSPVIQSESSLFISKILFGEFNGDSIIDLISLSNNGKVYTLTTDTLQLEDSDTISNSSITSVIQTNLNNDQITDLVLGTRLGEVFIYIGKDLTPPQIIQNSLNVSSTDASITISFTTNELAQAEITYSKASGSETTIKNDTLTKNQMFVINNLDSNTNYTIKLIITDQFGNSNNKTSLIIATRNPPPPYALYALGGFVLIIGAVGITFVVQTKRKQNKAFALGEKYYEAGEYILAIKSYIKANNKEKIIDIVTFLASNPQLSSFVDEIRQMEELESYMVDIQEIISGH